MTEPPAPAVAGADLDAQLSGHAPRGAFATCLFTAVALQSGLGMIRPPRTDVEALTAGTLEGPIYPAQRMEVGLTRFGVEALVQMRHNRHG
jgi:hypothetical protein